MTKIRTKLLFGFGIGIVTLLVLLAVAMNMLSKLNSNVTEVVSNRYEKVKIITGIRYDASLIDNNVQSLLLAPVALDVEPDSSTNVIDRSDTSINMAMFSLQNIILRDEAKDNVRLLQAAYNRYIDGQRQAVSIAQAGDITQATKVYRENTVYRQTLFLIIDELCAFHEQALASAFIKSSSLHQSALDSMKWLVVIGAILLGCISIWVTRTILRSLHKIVEGLSAVTYGATTLPRINISANDEFGEIAAAFNTMAAQMEEQASRQQAIDQNGSEQDWLKTKFTEITTLYQGVVDLDSLAQLFITKVTPLVGATFGVFYLRVEREGRTVLARTAHYALTDPNRHPDTVAFGEGLVGQCAADNRVLQFGHAPADYIRIGSGLGAANPASIIILPVAFEDEVLAVVELASFEKFTNIQQQLLVCLTENLGIALHSIAGRMLIEQLLRDYQAMTEELQTQAEELQMHQEELTSTNEQLAEQYRQSEQKTIELEQTRIELEEKARQLAVSSQYKSQFLANMSHELRTPLNSLLILAKLLMENKAGNLTPKQVEYARTIFYSGCDLLSLISDILDLSKIEYGKMDIHPEEVYLRDIADSMYIHFNPVAADKQLKFVVEIDADLPKSCYTDSKRLNQILKNLLANAFKFTHDGEVTLRFRSAGVDIAFEVTDTGIGIDSDKHRIIFEAFEQADGTTSRHYGGTGLGLTISRELAMLLGGRITVQSGNKQGSIFTLYLPACCEANYDLAAERYQAAATHTMESDMIAQEEIVPEDKAFAGKKVLIIDDDMRNIFALTTSFENSCMQVLFAETGREGLALLRNNLDTDLVLIDSKMSELDSYETMGLIREQTEFKRIPIIALGAKSMEEDREKCIAAGASDYISKPVNIGQVFSLLRVWFYR